MKGATILIGVLVSLSAAGDVTTDEPQEPSVEILGAKIETHIDQYSTVTMFALPEKVLIVRMHTLPGRSGALFQEGLRVNPVPDDYKTRGKKTQGTEWCAYVN